MADLETSDSGPPLSIQVAQGSRGSIVTLDGELDLSNVEVLESALAPIEGNTHVTFDLSGLRFMDSSGIAVLLQTAARTAGVSIARPSRQVRRVLESAGLTAHLDVEQ